MKSFVIDLLNARQEQRLTELGVNSLLPGRAKSGCEIRLLKELAKRFGKCSRFIRRNSKALFAIARDIRNRCCEICIHDRLPCSHRFQLDDTKSFCFRDRGKREHLRSIDVLLDLVGLKYAQKLHTIENAEFLRQALEISLKLDLADNNGFGVDVLHCAQKYLIALVADQPADRDHKLRVLCLQLVSDLALSRG